MALKNSVDLSSTILLNSAYAYNNLAFPAIIGKDFDCLIKGSFYQALLMKWQRKLDTPIKLMSLSMIYTHELECLKNTRNNTMPLLIELRSVTKSKSDDNSRKQSVKGQGKLPDQVTSKKDMLSTGSLCLSTVFLCVSRSDNYTVTALQRQKLKKL